MSTSIEYIFAKNKAKKQSQKTCLNIWKIHPQVLYLRLKITKGNLTYLPLTLMT